MKRASLALLLALTIGFASFAFMPPNLQKLLQLSVDNRIISVSSTSSYTTSVWPTNLSFRLNKIWPHSIVAYCGRALVDLGLQGQQYRNFFVQSMGAEVTVVGIDGLYFDPNYLHMNEQLIFNCREIQSLYE
jgi:hypothetical protein